MDIRIRPALEGEHEALTEIAFEAKGHWGYPPEYFEVWRDELTVTPDYIKNNVVFTALDGDAPVGFLSLVEVKEDFTTGSVLVEQGHWLEHLFIRPGYIKRGVGTLLMGRAGEYCRENGIGRLRIFVDPHAVGFYDRMGARFIGESPSSIGGRTVAMYEYRP